jgi:hypothetical protein
MHALRGWRAQAGGGDGGDGGAAGESGPGKQGFDLLINVQEFAGVEPEFDFVGVLNGPGPE